MAFIKELGFYPLNARNDFNAIKDFFKREQFNDKYLDEELEITKSFCLLHKLMKS